MELEKKSQCPHMSAAKAESAPMDSFQLSSLDGIAAGIGCSRRDLIGMGGQLIGAVAFFKLLAACKSVGGGKGASAFKDTFEIKLVSFLEDIKAAEAGTPLPSGFTIQQIAQEMGKQLAKEMNPAAAASAGGDPAVVAAVRARSAAVGKVIGTWLKDKPYVMIDELFKQDANSFPMFMPEIGTPFVFRHGHVIEALGNTDALTVGMYTRQMVRASEAEWDKTKPGSFILGTDKNDEYDADSRILRSILSVSDQNRLRKEIRAHVKKRIDWSKKDSPGKIDFIQAIGRYLPVDISGSYLGVPAFDSGKDCFMVYRGGMEFKISDKLIAGGFQFSEISKGKIPTQYDLYSWVRDAFRNIFNNVGGRDPSFVKAGVVATEYLTAYIHFLIEYYDKELDIGAKVPDTMLTRLLKMRRNAQTDAGLPASLGFASKEELLARLTDSRIRICVFGTVVGSIVNPEEANGRIAQAVLDFRSGNIQSVDASKNFDYFADRVKNHSDTKETLTNVNRLALELLRIRPQGEVLLRLCIKPTTIGGVGINPVLNSFMFVAHGAAMRDPSVIKDPEKIDLNRDPQVEKYSTAGDPRSTDLPQSKVYLQHGYGRHKCLGRYASEISMEEVLRSVLMLKNPRLASPLKMDLFNLYAENLEIEYDV